MREKRTSLVTLLVAVGVVAPCLAWYMAGSRATHEQAESYAAEVFREFLRAQNQ